MEGFVFGIVPSAGFLEGVFTALKELNVALCLKFNGFMAALKELRFLISAILLLTVPSSLTTLTLTSQRSEPCSILQSLTSMYSSVDLRSSRNAPASSALDMSGRVTISISGTPQRL
jgi:hypothetical protein